ncbi:hypothetical protein BKA60DRAFT_70433 [Fusarium oxysporum]|nr:hypothetical protein BKA60DRAFT_70433 [Fusarium oxysporum]
MNMPDFINLSEEEPTTFPLRFPLRHSGRIEISSKHSPWNFQSSCQQLSTSRHLMSTRKTIRPLIFQDVTRLLEAGAKRSKTYNSGDSLVVTDPTTNPPLISLSMGERTGSRVL